MASLQVPSIHSSPFSLFLPSQVAVFSAGAVIAFIGIIVVSCGVTETLPTSQNYLVIPNISQKNTMVSYFRRGFRWYWS